MKTIVQSDTGTCRYS